ncbi:type II toxin-antitoxin system HicA family toxin [bacterium]|nr:type II toxin-antitoxin system HicA family toxin [bacterium]
MAKVLERAGFICVRSRGSHFAYRHPDGRLTSIPFHGSGTLSARLINQIIDQAQLSAEEYTRLVAESR